MQIELALHLESKPPSLCDKLAVLLIANEGRWVDARELAHVGGFVAWRTRLSELRRERHMTIANRWRDVTTAQGQTYRVSEYRYEGTH